MSHYIIIDSNISYASKLHKALTGSNVETGNFIIDSVSYIRVSDLCDFLFPNEKDKSTRVIKKDTVILINAETELTDKYLQHQGIVELIFWLRCKYKCNNPIVFYSCVSINHSLKRDPENFILLSPNCYYYKLPITENTIDYIKNLKPITDVNLKPYLKPALNLDQVRHLYSNLAGMVLMFEVAQIKQEKVLLESMAPFFSTKIREFVKSINYYLLKAYFNLTTKGISSFCKVDFVKQTKKILLIDDLAKEGWRALISQMLYGEPNTPEIIDIDIHSKNITEFDEEKTIEELDNRIKEHKPHLILLDLRLIDEQGKKPLSEFSGYKLLKYLKSHALYKGIHVIMFTATSNAEMVKELLRAGAEAVWTKPGIDEGLCSEEIVIRYEQFLKLVRDGFSNYYFDNLSSLNDRNLRLINQEQKFNSLSLEEMEQVLLKQTNFIKYRCEINKCKEVEHFFNDFTDIYIDTNTLMTGHNNKSAVDFSETILNIYKLAQICNKQEHKFQVKLITENKHSKPIEEKYHYPKLVVMNQVLFEILRKSKEGVNNENSENAWKRALIGYSIIRGLFDDQNIIRTDFNCITNNLPKSSLDKYLQSHYADDPIVNDIINIVSGKIFEIPSYYYSSRYKRYYVENQFDVNYVDFEKLNVLLICDENDTNEEKIPNKLLKKYNAVSSPKGKYQILRLKEFNAEMNKILL